MDQAENTRWVIESKLIAVLGRSQMHRMAQVERLHRMDGFHGLVGLGRIAELGWSQMYQMAQVTRLHRIDGLHPLVVVRWIAGLG